VGSSSSSAFNELVGSKVLGLVLAFVTRGIQRKREIVDG
jgi:hypothetical protein